MYWLKVFAASQLKQMMLNTHKTAALTFRVDLNWTPVEARLWIVWPLLRLLRLLQILIVSQDADFGAFISRGRMDKSAKSKRKRGSEPDECVLQVMCLFLFKHCGAPRGANYIFIIKGAQHEHFWPWIHIHVLYLEWFWFCFRFWEEKWVLDCCGMRVYLSSFLSIFAVSQRNKWFVSCSLRSHFWESLITFVYNTYLNDIRHIIISIV